MPTSMQMQFLHRYAQWLYLEKNVKQEFLLISGYLSLPRASMEAVRKNRPHSSVVYIVSTRIVDICMCGTIQIK